MRPRLLPRSLFGRLALVLTGVLVGAQLVALALTFADRGQVFYRAVGQPLAQRIAEMVTQLDAVDGFARLRLLQSLESPRLRVLLLDQPLGSEQAANGWRGLLFERLLRRELGEQRHFLLALDEEPPPGLAPPPHRPGHRPGMHRRLAEFGVAPEGALWVRVEVALQDGQWAAFYRLLPREAFVSPTRLLAGLALLLAAVIAVSLLAVHWLTRPLDRLATAADDLGRDLNRPPLDEDGPDEVRRALQAFNTMQQRLARLVNDRARILAAISHDLKTPLTRLRLRAELLDDAALQAKINADLDEMTRLVDTTLDFMRDAAGDEAPAATDLDALLGSLQADYADAGRQVEIDGEARLTLTLRPHALRRCLANLVDNALHYAGSATLALEQQPGEVLIRVLDRGPGLPEAELERVFEPFHRADGARTRDTGGTGLGLSIARSIARAHGGELRLCNRPGGGLEARLQLPR